MESMDWVQELVSGRTGMASLMLRACDPDLEVELELELAFDDYEIYDFTAHPPVVVDDYAEIVYVTTTDDDGWFFASDEVIATIEDVALPEPTVRWPFVIAAGFVLTLAASVAISI